MVFNNNEHCSSGYGTLSPEVLGSIFSYLDGSSLQHVAGVNRLSREVVRGEWRERVHRFTSTHIREVSTFYDVLGQISAVVSGSTALAVLVAGSRLEGEWVHRRDLDIYVPSLDAFGVLQHHLKTVEGYRPTSIPFDDLDRYIEEPACIASLARFRRVEMGNESERYIDVIIAKDNSATLPTIAFWGTLVMNYISSTRVVSLYPRLTLTGRGIGNPHANEGRVRNGMQKYIDRGFYMSSFVHDTQACFSRSSYCPSVLRFTEDAQCMTVPWSNRVFSAVLGTRSPSMERVFSVTPSFWVWGRCPPSSASPSEGYAVGRL